MHSAELTRKYFRRLLLTKASQAAADRFKMKRTLVHLVAPPITPALNLIEAAEAKLKKKAAGMESRFLESGDALEVLSQSSQSLVDNSAELVRLATGRREAEQLISSTMAVLAEPLAFLDRYTNQLVAQTASLREGCTILNRLMDFEVDLQSAVAPLRTTRTMFRVEAARLPESDRAAFLSLSDQIETLHSQVRDTFGLEFAKLTETRMVMNQLVKRLAHESSLQQDVLASERSRISAELEKLNLQINLNSNRESQLTVFSKSVQGAVSRVVMALQNQDFVAQRTQHVFEGLNQIRALGRTLENGESERLHDDVAHLQAMLQIQSGQVSSSFEHLEETASASAAATAEIIATVDQLDHECASLNQFTEVTTAANGTIQVLLDIVDETCELVASSVQLGSSVLEHIQPVTSLTTQLSDSVDRLSNQMNLVALNAQIQALQVGTGTGLEVLAAHTAAVATETSRFGEAIRKDFGRLRDFLKIEVSAIIELCEAGQVQQTYMDSAGRGHKVKLHRVRDEIVGRMLRIGEDGARVRASAQRTAAASMLGAGEAEAFSNLQASLSRMADGLKDVLAGFSPNDSYMELDHSGYTMASERENHRKVVGRDVTAPVVEEQSGLELF